VIHRDLKPSNVMVGGFGEVLVMDWGLAKVLPRGGIADDERVSQASGGREPPGSEEPTVIHTARSGSGSGSDTQAGSVMGTPAFMPPEQAGGEVDKLDERADVFGLGAVLCVLLTGHPPYVAGSGDEVRLMAVRGKLVEAYGRLDACGADAELVSLCKRCLAAEREDRPRNADGVATAVQQYLSGVEERARKAEVDRAAAEARAEEEVKTRQMAEAKTVAERKRRRTQLALAASVAIVVGLVGFGLWWEERRNAAHRTQVALRAAADEAELTRRRTATERDVGAAVDTMRAIIADARRQEDNPDQMTLVLRSARSYLERAEASVQLGAPTDAVREQVAAATADMTQADKDAKLLVALQGIGTGCEILLLPEGVSDAASYEAAFREYGLDVFNAPPDEVAAHLQQHPHFVHLYTALLRWGVGFELDSLRSGRLIAVMSKLHPPPDSGTAQFLAVYAGLGGLKRLASLARTPEAARWKPVEVKLISPLLFIESPEVGFDLLRRAVEHHPNSFDLNLSLGARLAASPRPEDNWESLRHLTAAVSLNPRHAAAMVVLARVLSDLWDDEAAARWMQRAVDTDPKFVPARNGLAWWLAAGPDRVRDGRRAVEHATTACELTGWRSPEVIDTLAAAYAEDGDFDKAVECQKKALDLVPRVRKQTLAEYRQRLALYERRQPYRDPRYAAREVLPPPREDK
jgi:tetratricopeptide (TPR) repeat protein